VTPCEARARPRGRGLTLAEARPEAFSVHGRGLGAPAAKNDGEPRRKSRSAPRKTGRGFRRAGISLGRGLDGVPAAQTPGGEPGYGGGGGKLPVAVKPPADGPGPVDICTIFVVFSATVNTAEITSKITR
jgi:hypothetical protein